MSRIRGILAWILVIAVIGLAIGGAWGFVLVRASFPQTSGTVTVDGLGAAVEVRRDEYGIPQITADTSADLFFAQGYVHAQDRFWEMDFRRHVTSGRLAEWFGEDQIETDAFIRTMGWRRIAEQELEILDPTTISYLTAYAAGVNAYLAERDAGAALSLEYAALGLKVSDYVPETWTPADSVAWLKAMAWDLSGNLEEEWTRVTYASGLSDAQIADLDPGYPYDRHPVIAPHPGGGTARADTATARSSVVDLQAVAARLAGIAALSNRLTGLTGLGGRDGIGSNSFAVAGSHTASGKPILVNDPHLAPTMPGIWYQVGLHCRAVSDACPFDVTGFSFSGVPGIVLGHNARVAWGFTNLGPDVQDLYLEDVQGDTYRVGNSYKDLAIRLETIEVAGGDPRTIRVRSTPHGPLISDASEWYRYVGTVAPAAAVPGVRAAPDISLQWTALTPGVTMDAIFLINTAANFDDFRAAASKFEVPSQNMLYADVDGHIGYQSPGRIPIRRTGDGKWPAPGWDPAYAWVGYADFDDLPWVLDPAEGYIVTANNAVVTPDYPVFLTDDWSYGARAARLAELVGPARGMTLEAALTIDFDQKPPLVELLLPTLTALPLTNDDADLADALALFDGWDGQATADSTPAALLNAVWSHLVARTFNDELLSTGAVADGSERWMEIIRPMLADPTNAWWDDVSTPDTTEDRDTTVHAALADAVAELDDRLGLDESNWHWGRLHTLELVNQTFGKSGIGPLEWLFNRGPYHLGGGRDALDATSWDASQGYEVSFVPSMRMAIDLANLDASRYIQLSGNSGHAFDQHYDDQAPLWATGQTIPWPFSGEAVGAVEGSVLILEPAGGAPE